MDHSFSCSPALLAVFHLLLVNQGVLVVMKATWDLGYISKSKGT